jgi:hypothetical protein
MTPLQITMMLHYYAIAAPYAQHEPEHAISPAVRSQTQDLADAGLIEPSSTSGSGWRSTDKGKAYVEMLCDLPVPVCKWVQP